MSSYTVTETGAANTTDYKIYFSNANGPISPFHDIPLYADAKHETYNMIVEIPRWTNAKMEISKEDKLNPIKQDVKKGKLRFVDNVFPYKGYIWNYGAFPQTWEDPGHTHNDTECKGDNDPLDVCEIGSKIQQRGAVIQVKVLGVLAMIDEGETDWKIMVIDVNDPMAEKLNDINDIENHMPGLLKATRTWLKVYKIPQGKPPNEFAYGGEFKDKAFALQIIEETHKQWQSLLGKVIESNGIACENVMVAGSPYLIDREDAKSVVDGSGPFKQADNGPDATGDVWHFVQG